jgi:hypothetical protein
MRKESSVGSAQFGLLSKLQDQLMFLSKFEAELLGHIHGSKELFPTSIGKILGDIANE